MGTWRTPNGQWATRVLIHWRPEPSATPSTFGFTYVTNEDHTDRDAIDAAASFWNTIHGDDDDPARLLSAEVVSLNDPAN